MFMWKFELFSIKLVEIETAQGWPDIQTAAAVIFHHFFLLHFALNV